MDVPDGIAELQSLILLVVSREERKIFIDMPRDDVEIEPLGLARLVEHEKLQALRRSVGQPFLDRQAVALRLRDLLTLFVQEQLIGEAGRLRAADVRADAAGELPVID